MTKKLLLMCLLLICPLAKPYQYKLVFFDTRPEVLDYVHAEVFRLNGQWYFSGTNERYRIYNFYFTNNVRTPYAMVVIILDDENRPHTIYADIMSMMAETEAEARYLQECDSTCIPPVTEEHE
ncbi:hypothetical protein [Endozoicomonas lisbonensis]|uniref:Curli production assembly/transport component CsgE n=1 Tax=Endozoicomonas lisbonensis TaxID=3120522 RepID=A0ABV2SLU9_9GAMM